MKKSCIATAAFVLLICSRSYAGDLIVSYSAASAGVTNLPGAGELLDFPPFDTSLGSLESVTMSGTTTISTPGYVGVWSPLSQDSTVGGLTYSVTAELVGLAPSGAVAFTAKTSSVPVGGELTPDIGGVGTSFNWQPTLLTPTASFVQEWPANVFEGSRFMLTVSGQTYPTNLGVPNPGQQAQNAQATYVVLNGSIDYTYAPVPEPAPLTLLAAASLSLALSCGRRRH